MGFALVLLTILTARTAIFMPVARNDRRMDVYYHSTTTGHPAVEKEKQMPFGMSGFGMPSFGGLGAMPGFGGMGMSGFGGMGMPGFGGMSGFGGMGMPGFGGMGMPGFGGMPLGDISIEISRG